MGSRTRWLVVAAAVVALLGGGFYLVRGGAGAEAPAERQRDPGFAVLLALRTLDREPATRMTKEQIQKVLPFIKALKDVPVSDAVAAAAIARAVRDVFTPAQVSALDEARRQFQERQREAGAAGAGGGPGLRGQPGGPATGQVTDEQRNEFRRRAFDRMIRALERRMKS